MNPRSLTSVLMRTIVIISDDCETDGGQNGRKSANIEVKIQKSAKTGTILSA